MITENVLNNVIKGLTSRLDRLVFRAGWKHWVVAGPGIYHEHPGWELVFHPNNQGEVRLENGNTAKFGPGDIVITPPYRRHIQNNITDGDDFCLVMDWDGDSYSDHIPIIHLGCTNDEFVTRELFFLTSGVSQGSIDAHTVLNYRLRALLAVLLFNGRNASVAYPPEPIVNNYVDLAIRMLDESYVDVNLEIRQLARTIGVSSDYLRHLFQSKLGLSPKQYLLQRRLARVEELLCHSNLSLKEIAALSGFANERYLCAYFRQNKHITPGTFREQRKILT